MTYIKTLFVRQLIKMEGKVRLFVGIPVVGSLGDEYESFQLNQKDIVGLRWINPAFFHLTLCFIGSVRESTLDNIEKKISKISKRYSPFSIDFKDISLFPNKKPRLVLANYQLNNTFKELAEELHDELLDEAIEEIHPHVTLGRYKKKQYGLLKRLELGFTPDEKQVYVSKIILWKSETKHTGAVYHIINEFELT